MSESILLTPRSHGAARFRASKVLGLAGDAARAQRLEEALLDAEGVDLRVVSTGSAELIAQFARQFEPDAIVIDADLSDAAAGPAIDRALQSELGGRPLIVRAGAMRSDAARRLMRLGAAELVDEDAPPAELAAAVAKTLAKRATPQSARVTAFFSTRGGVGVSTLAVETAVAIAQRLPANGPGACLVDLNLQFGVDAALLNLQPNLKTSAPLDPSRIDAQVLDAFLSDHKSRLQLLAAPAEWRESAIQADGVARLLDVAAERFSHVVIDLPKQLNMVTEAVMASADQFFVVTDLSVPGLQLARATIAALDTRLPSTCTLSVIVNRVSRWDRGVALTMRDVRRMLQCERIFVVHEDMEAAAEAMDRGEPMLITRPESRVAREITEAIRHAFPVEFGGEDRKSRAPSGFLNLIKYR